MHTWNRSMHGSLPHRASCYNALANGDYTVTVTDAPGCSSTSDAFVRLSTGTSVQGIAFTIHPNPTNGPVLARRASIHYG